MTTSKHRNTVVALQKRRKRSWRNTHALTIVLAIARMRVSMRPRLLVYERVLITKLYHSAGAMRQVQEVGEVLSAAGISAGTEELEDFLINYAWFVPGKVLECRQFMLLAKYLKKRFMREQQVPDSAVAFGALSVFNPEKDDEPYVSAGELRGVCKHFQLTIDIEAFIREHDEDGSEKLEIDEFSALFKDPDLHDGADVHTARAQVQQSKTTVNTASDDLLDDPDAPNKALADAQAQKAQAQKELEMTPAAVLAGVDQWIETKPAIVDDTHKPRKRRAAGTNPGEGSTRADAESAERQRQRALWERGNEAAAQEALRAKKEHIATNMGRCGFGSSRRFEQDEYVAPLPPPKGPSQPQPRRGNFRDGPVTARSVSSQFGSREGLPSVSSARGNGEPPQWYEHNPFAGNAGSAAGVTSAATTGSGRRSRRAAEQSQTPKLPLIARDGRKKTVMCQPEMTF